MLFLKQFWQHIRSPQGSMVDFGPRNALNEKCPATFLVRNVMENTFRTYLRHLESIWSGPKCYISANKYAILLVHLTSFYDFYEFPMHKSISDHPKSISNVSNKSEMYSPSHFGPKRSPDTFRLEHSLVRNWPLNPENLWHVIKITSKTAFLRRFLKICMGL